MNIALYGKNFDSQFEKVLRELLNKLSLYKACVHVYKPMLTFLKERNIDYDFAGEFDDYQNLSAKLNFLVSIGGDGTFLSTISLVRNSGIPVIGVNSGRLGFLANIAKEEIAASLEALFQGRYNLDERSLLELTSDSTTLEAYNYALNDITFQKVGASMITIHVKINNEFLNTYFTDGLIISTPTGSTAYSLSVGGPLLTPHSRCFIISPIASHNLNVRPIVVPDECELKIMVNGRNHNYAVTIDSQNLFFNESLEFTIKMANFKIKMVKLETNTFYNTLRNKLMWGVDKRY
jgi:NAD+ kinase